MNRLTKRYCQLYESAKGKPEDERKFWGDVRADFKKRNCTSRDFSIQGLFERFVTDRQGAPCGREIVDEWRSKGGLDEDALDVRELSEAGMGAVTTGAFSKITGQIVYNEVLDAWNQPQFIADSLARTVNTQFLDGEKIAGISVVGDEAEAIGEAQPYPLTGITQRYVDTPRPVKRGHILPLTREVIIADRTNVLLDRAQTISTTMRMNKEKRAIDNAMGVNDTWKVNGSAALNTYGSSSGQHNFANTSSNPLVDYTDIETVLNAMDGFTDPDTGEPIVTNSNQILVPGGLLFTARRIVTATQVQVGSRATSSPIELSSSPLNTAEFGGARHGQFEIMTSPYVAARMTASSSQGDNTITSTTWFMGNFRMAFRYMQVWPLSVDTMPANSMWEFQSDIVRAWKVSEFGVYAVVEPRHVYKST